MTLPTPAPPGAVPGVPFGRIVAAMTAHSDTLTVPEAATVAGVSVRTMRRWASSGQVAVVGRGHGRRIVAASLSKPAASTDTSGQDDRPPLAEDAATTDTETARAAITDSAAIEADRLADLVRELTARLAEASAVAAMWQERARALADQRAIAAPEPPQAPVQAESARRRADVPRWPSQRAWAALTAVVLVLVVAGIWAWR